MKDKILEIIENSITVSPSGLSVIRTGHAAEEIAQMMCDREAVIWSRIFYSMRGDLGIAIRMTKTEMMNRDEFTPEQIDNALNKLQ